MKRSVLGAVLAAAVLGLTLPSAALAADEIVENGTFASPHVPDDASHEFLPATTPGIGHWQVLDGSVDLYGHRLARYHHQAVDLNGGQPGTIQQLIQTTPGTTVTLHWQHARNTHPACQQAWDQNYRVDVAGVTEVFLADGPIGHWQPQTFGFKAQKTQYLLRFGSGTQGACGALVTDISATAA